MGVISKLKQVFSSSGPKKSLPRADISKRFELLHKAGQGSMSKVHRARDRKLGRIVCLKILDKEKTALHRRELLCQFLVRCLISSQTTDQKLRRLCSANEFFLLRP